MGAAGGPSASESVALSAASAGASEIGVAVVAPCCNCTRCEVICPCIVKQQVCSNCRQKTAGLCQNHNAGAFVQGKRVSRTPSVTDSAGQPSNGMGSPSKIRNTVRVHQSTAVRVIDGSSAVAASPSAGTRMPRCVEMVIRLCDEKRKAQAAAAGSYSFSEQDMINVESMINEFKQMRARFQTSHKEATQTNVLVQKKQQELEKNDQEIQRYHRKTQD